MPPDKVFDTDEHPTVKEQAHRLRERFPILYYGFLCTWVSMIVLAVGVAVVVGRSNQNTQAIKAGTCVIVATLEQGAADAQATLDKPAGPLSPDRRQQLADSVSFQLTTANKIRARLTCPPKPEEQPRKVP